jgi:hypothetical protein
MARTVIVAYKPKPGKDAALLSAIRKHASILRAEGLITERPVQAMQASDGTVIEVFEWRSAEAIARADRNAAVHSLWAEFGAACEYVPLATLSEGQQMFAEFDALEL